MVKDLMHQEIHMVTIGMKEDVTRKISHTVTIIDVPTVGGVTMNVSHTLTIIDVPTVGGIKVQFCGKIITSIGRDVTAIIHYDITVDEYLLFLIFLLKMVSNSVHHGCLGGHCLRIGL